MAALDHAASGGHRSCAGERGAGRGFPQIVAEKKFYGFVDADRAAGDSMVAESLRYAGVWALVLLPDAKVGATAIGRLGDLFAGPAFLERGRNVERFALSGQDHGEQALSTFPADAGEVIERRALS